MLAALERARDSDAWPERLLLLAADVGSAGPRIRIRSFPPGTSLTKKDEQEIGIKRCMSVRAGVSTQRPNVDWCDNVDSKPTLRRPRKDEVGPLMPAKMEFQEGDLIIKEANRLESEERAQRGYFMPVRTREGDGSGLGVVRSDEGRAERWELKSGAQIWSGRLSKRSPVTLEKNREQLKIHPDAREFAFAYPDNNRGLSARASPPTPPESSPQTLNAQLLDGTGDVAAVAAAAAAATTSHASPRALTPPVEEDAPIGDVLKDSFRSGGGFLYFDEDGKLIGATAFRERKYMVLTGPFDVPEGLRKDRWDGAEEVTLKNLTAVGIKRFVWLEPSTSEEWKHGGFCYFYDDAQKQFDCIFTVTEDMKRTEQLFRRRRLSQVKHAKRLP